jgi:hypothetical protein
MGLAKTAATANAAAEPVKTCGIPGRIILDRVSVQATCTEKPGHKGDHYDEIYSYSWQL